jgi:D-beta-D-heptose 7-phosphate kinase / D-beta-D-heptose 1-phosphate adenosyltransferase
MGAQQPGALATSNEGANCAHLTHKHKTMSMSAPFPKFSNLPNGRVLVVGDVMLDCYWHGQVHRISPEAPVPVVGVQREDLRLGGAANVAANVAALGGRAHLVGLIGDDKQGDDVHLCLAQQNINSSLRRLQGLRTVTKLRVLARHQQLIRLDFEQVFPKHEAEQLGHDLESRLAWCDVVVFSDYAKGVLQDCGPWIKAARAAGTFSIVDPKGTDFNRYSGADMLTPNVNEFEAVVGHCPDLATLENRARALCADLDVRAVLVTRGEHGMSLVMARDGVVHLPAHAKEVFDVTGAGDTVVATLALAVAAGSTLPEAVELSNLAAGLVVSRVGAASISAAALEAAWHAQPSIARKRVTAPAGEVGLARLLTLRDLARQKGQRVIMTNGCFDVLHPGHIAFLEEARSLGDHLLVAINDDASVRRLKGPTRPVHPLSDRMRMLTALASVDWVVPFSEDTPESLVAQVLPDVLVKGGDYTPEQIAGGQHVLSSGGQVRVLALIPGYSSTSVIQRIGQHPSTWPW